MANSAATVDALRRAAQNAVDHFAFEQGVQLYELAVATIERLHSEEHILGLSITSSDAALIAKSLTIPSGETSGVFCVQVIAAITTALLTFQLGDQTITANLAISTLG